MLSPRSCACFTIGSRVTESSAAYKTLFDIGWGKHALRIAISIGDDADLEVCNKFAGRDVSVLRTETVVQNKSYLRLVS